MMSELKPCPFCGGKVEHQLTYDGAYSFTCDSCGLNARFTEDIARAVPAMLEHTEWLWNMRYRPMCHITDMEISLEPIVQYEHREHIYHCEECHSEFSLVLFNEDGDSWCEKPKYCPHCGMKVMGR